MPDFSDYDLVRKCLTGNIEAFSDIVSRYSRLIYNVAYNLMRDPQDVGDIAQEAFIRIYKALGRYNPEYRFSTWAVKITTNLCLDMLRKKKTASVPMEQIEDMPGEWDTPEEQYVKRERSHRIKVAIAELPDMYRVPVLLFHKHGMSYEEIAKIIGEPMTIVKNRLYRARLMLRQKLSDEKGEMML